MMEGVLCHCTDMEINHQYVDSHEQSEVAFAFSDVLGFDLLPRLKAIAQQKLYVCEKEDTLLYPHLTPVLARGIDRMENGDVLVVTKLDCLGRNAMDVRKTVEQLAASGIRVHCLALGGVDLTSPAGKMTMQMISAIAEFGKDC